MNEIFAALHDAKRKKKRRLNDNSNRRRKARLKARLDRSDFTDFVHNDQSHAIPAVPAHTDPITETCPSVSDHPFILPPSVENCQEETFYNSASSPDVDHMTFEDLMARDQTDN